MISQADVAQVVRQKGGGEPPLWAEVNTFQDLVARGEALANWMDRVRTDVLEPVFAKWPITSPQPSEDPKRGDPGTLYVSLMSEALGGNIRVQPMSERNWERGLDRIRQGRLKSFSVDVWIRGASGYPSKGGRLTVEANLRGLSFAGAAHVLLITASPSVLRQPVREVQSAWVTVTQFAAATFDAAYGYITQDHASYRSPYELSAGVLEPDGLVACADSPRGYYWGNFLSRRHVERLGGMTVLSACPHYLPLSTHRPL